MIRGGFLSGQDRRALVGIARDGLAEHRIARRANAMVLLDEGWSCERVGAALLLDDDTVRNWRRAYERGGVEGLRSFGHEGAGSRLSREQETALSDWVGAELPRSARLVGAWLARTFGQRYSRSGLIVLLHRLGFDYRKPEAMPRGLDDAKQQAFIDDYENLLNTMEIDEAVVFVDAVHPTHQVRPVGCWAPKGVAIAVEQTTGRDRLNIHGAINLDRPDPGPRRRAGRWAEFDQAPWAGRERASRDAPHPRLSRQRRVSSRQHRQAVAGEA